MRPLVGWGERLSERADRGGIGSSALLGVATGLLWAPCAGPILGIILTGAALSGASATTAGLLLAYALGAATSLALALLVGGRVFAAMKRSIGAGEGVRKALGVLMLVAVGTIALGLDTRVLARLSTAQTFSFEHRIAQLLGMEEEELSTKVGAGKLPVEGPLPSLDGAVLWLNSPPLTREQLKGKVVLVDFWTYSCINCIRSIPYVRAWAERYRDKGLVVIGVHTPEFAFERDPANVRKAVAEFGIRYPVALDNELDHLARLRQPLLARPLSRRRPGAHPLPSFRRGPDRRDRSRDPLAARRKWRDRARRQIRGQGRRRQRGGRLRLDPQPRNLSRLLARRQFHRSRAEHSFAIRPTTTHCPRSSPSTNGGFGAAGPPSGSAPSWARQGAASAFRFHARDLHLVLGSASGKPVRFRVMLDGKPPGADHGMDIDAQGYGQVTGQRLYQLVRQKGGSRERLFSIEFLDPGAEAYAFTFG